MEIIGVEVARDYIIYQIITNLMQYNVIKKANLEFESQDGTLKIVNVTKVYKASYKLYHKLLSACSSYPIYNKAAITNDKKDITLERIFKNSEINRIFIQRLPSKAG